MWSFSSFGHGKGSHDGASAIFKCFILQARLDVESPKLQNAKQVVSLLKKKLSG
jgi:hypothetical protein